jgi:protein TonB
MRWRDHTGGRDRVLLALEQPSPRLPETSLSVKSRLLIAGLVHLAIGAFVVSLPSAPSPVTQVQTLTARTEATPRLVFVAPPIVARGGGGGGGGNRQTGPLPRARAPGQDRVTLPAARSRVPDAVESPLPPSVQPLALDSKPLASGETFLAGLPDAGPPLSSSARGPGSGEGFGTGDGSGIGSGSGAGVGPGTGGGIGGGVYRPGGAVSAPVLVTQVRPTYTEKALSDRIQGPVELELIVRRDGRPDAIRVVRSLDRGGLDAEAVRAVRQWRFQPGLLNGSPVDVLVTVVVNFNLH